MGLDSDYDRLPDRFKEKTASVRLQPLIIEQTHACASAYKPNIAFYEARGIEGLRSLEATQDYLHEHHLDISDHLCVKRADIGSTNRGYVTAIFDRLGFDAVTLNPYSWR